ncbi:hypothetical protein [Pseudoalteromonas umbrosa]|nr:hypothetical protein [Pseudoalteromonas sp. B95]MDK1289003.1 hypothetical protein [Pseudoalteromonas sp. B95]
MTPHIAGGSSRLGGGSYEPTQPTICEMALCHTAPELSMACNITDTSLY